MIRMTPAVRISIGLVLLTVTILMASDFVGFLPNQNKAEIDARRKLCESLAVQFSILASKKDIQTIQEILTPLVKRNDDIDAAVLRTYEGKIVAEAGTKRSDWNPLVEGKSTSDYVSVPIYQGDRRWGYFEVRFSPLWMPSMDSWFNNSFLGLILFVSVTGFFAYFLFMKRTLRELDPSAVIPERVKAAFDALAEGVLILDEKENIILANAAFSEKSEKSAEALMGVRVSDLNWISSDSENSKIEYPWTRTLRTTESETGIRLTLSSLKKTEHSLMVNAAPILDGSGKSRGVLVTFDDVTELEEKNTKLEEQNEELHYLATRDPMTGCLNRRAFYAQFGTLFSEAKEKGLELSCIMTDIDHFKAVNDNYGHGVGDDIIKLVANIYQSKSREGDVVGRYGGEEFCVVLPGLDSEQAGEIAEQMRIAVKEESIATFATGPHIAASFGVVDLTGAANTFEDMTNQADEALYFSKENGRDKVTCWSEETLLRQASKSIEDASSLSENTGGEEGNQINLSDEDSKGVKVERLKIRIKELETSTQELSQQLTHSTNYDTLTGLVNRTVFSDRIDQAISRAKRNQTSVVVFSLDVNMLQHVNDMLGYSAGDLILQESAHRLITVFRETDTIAYTGSDGMSSILSRVNGNEFGILLEAIGEMDAVNWIIERLFSALSRPIEIDDHEIYTTSNIGVSCYPTDGDNAERLLQHASAARNHAGTQSGNDNYQFFAPEMNEKSLKQLTLENQLRRALESNEFVLFYQPKVDLQTGVIHAVEALIRWEHPELGFVPPNEFIPISESTGLINSIGEWIIRTACLQMKEWMDCSVEKMRVAVNLSAIQLRQGNIADLITSILDETGLPPNRLELEITESAIMENMETAIASLHRLHNLGIAISVDDFGTGYSSLNYLKLFPVDTLKIDRSFLLEFTENNQDFKIVSAIVAMAHSLGLTVIAEGVETYEQLELLKTLKCDGMQGYLFSRPVSAIEATHLLASNSLMQLPVPQAGQNDIRLLDSA
ncbi:MAG: EAL domain-containing protein [Methylococcales bacterium]